MKTTASEVPALIRTIDHLGLVKFVAGKYNLGTDDLIALSRRRTQAHARHMAMALERHLTALSWSELGVLWNRSHSTVLYACKSVAKRGGIPADWVTEAEHFVEYITGNERVIKQADIMATRSDYLRPSNDKDKENKAHICDECGAQTPRVRVCGTCLVKLRREEAAIQRERMWGTPLR